MSKLEDYKFNIRLVKTVKKYPILYNTELKESSMRDCRERAWIDVAEELNCDPNTAKNKWKICRTILLRKLRQIQMGEPVKNWYLYNHIKYIIPYLKKSYEPGTLKRTFKQSLPEANEDTDTEYKRGSGHSTEDIEIIEEFAESSDESDENNAASSEDGAATDGGDELVSTPQHIEPTDNILIIDKVSNGATNQVVTAPVRYTVQRNQTESTESPKRQFVLSLLPDLNEMTNSEMRQFKCKVLQLIEQILNENNT